MALYKYVYDYDYDYDRPGGNVATGIDRSVSRTSTVTRSEFRARKITLIQANALASRTQSCQCNDTRVFLR